VVGRTARRDWTAFGQQLAVVVEEDHAVAQQAPALFGVAGDDVGGGAVSAVRRRAWGPVWTHCAPQVRKWTGADSRFTAFVRELCLTCTDLVGDANSSVELVDTAAPIGAGSSSGGRLWAYHRGRTIAGRGYAGRGDSLALASRNSAEFLVTYYACAKLGVICVPINLGWRTNEVAYVLGHSCARGIVIESQLLPVLDSALVEVPAVADVIVISYELAAAGERGTTFAQLTEGFDAGRLLELIESERITQIFGPPMMYRQMLDHPDVAGRDLSSLRRALYAMAPMPEAQLRRCLEVFGCEFYLLFGQTEMSPTATLFRPEHQLSHAGAVGTPVANVQVAIMDGGGRLVPQGESGEIVYRGPHTMTEYLHNPAATEAAFAHGWFHSGDVGHFDADGILGSATGART